MISNIFLTMTPTVTFHQTFIIPQLTSVEDNTMLKKEKLNLIDDIDITFFAKHSGSISDDLLFNEWS